MLKRNSDQPNLKNLYQTLLLELKELTENKTSDTIPFRVISAISALEQINRTENISLEELDETYQYGLGAKALLEEKIQNSQEVMNKKIFSLMTSLTDLIKTKAKDETYKQIYNVLQELDAIYENPNLYREETINETYSYALSLRNEAEGLGNISY